jgi:tetratricopeptide (TPR) repeat protein
MGFLLTARWRAAQGSYAAAAMDVERALPICRELGNLHETAAAWLALGSIRLQQGDFATARQHLADAQAIARSAGMADLADIELALVEAALDEHRLDDAEQAMTSLLSRGPERQRPQGWLLEARIALAHGHADQARAAVDRARGLIHGDADAEQHLWLDVVGGAVRAAAERATERAGGRHILAAAARAAHSGGWFAPELEARLALADLALREHARDAAQAQLDAVGPMIATSGALRWRDAYDRLRRDIRSPRRRDQ